MLPHCARNGRILSPTRLVLGNPPPFCSGTPNIISLSLQQQAHFCLKTRRQARSLHQAKPLQIFIYRHTSTRTSTNIARGFSRFHNTILNCCCNFLRGVRREWSAVQARHHVLWGRYVCGACRKLPLGLLAVMPEIKSIVASSPQKKKVERYLSLCNRCFPPSVPLFRSCTTTNVPNILTYTSDQIDLLCRYVLPGHCYPLAPSTFPDWVSRITL